MFYISIGEIRANIYSTCSICQQQGECVSLAMIDILNYLEYPSLPISIWICHKCIRDIYQLTLSKDNEVEDKDQ